MKVADFELLCPECRIECRYKEQSQRFECGECLAHYPLIGNNLVSFLPQQYADTDFYDGLYAGTWEQREPVITLRNKVAQCLINRLSMSGRKHRFFKKHMKRGDHLILDLACGYGRELLTTYGKVIGLDIAASPLLQASQSYAFCVHANASRTPFKDDYFDYIISSDFLGHVPLDQKDALYREMYRILKTNGKMLHILETDSTNWHFRYAHRHPQLFQKYFVERIGGHVGLEMPHRALTRFQDSGFKLIDVKKIWGDIWRVEEYRMMFDNEYRDRSKFIKGCVCLSKLLTAKVGVGVAFNILVNPFAALIERLTRLDNAQGICVFCEKT